MIPALCDKQLRDRRFGNRRMKALDIPPDAIVETQLPLLAELHDAGGGETLRMRGHAEAVARRERHSADEIGVPEGLLEDHPTIVNDRDNTTRLRGIAHLVFEPAGDVIERGLQPFIHGSVLQSRYHASRPRGSNSSPPFLNF
jgi:hypothetical protein